MQCQSWVFPGCVAVLQAKPGLLLEPENEGGLPPKKAVSSVIPHRQREGDCFGKMSSLSSFPTLFFQTKLIIFAYTVTVYSCDKTIGSGGFGWKGCCICGGRKVG